LEASFAALQVGILDAQNHDSALAAGKQPIKQCRTSVADVEMAGGRWRKTHADLF